MLQHEVEGVSQLPCLYILSHLSRAISIGKRPGYFPIKDKKVKNVKYSLWFAFSRWLSCSQFVCNQAE